MAAIQTDPQYKLRLSEDLRDRLRQASETNARSLNSEIIARLQWSFEAPTTRDPLTHILRPITEIEFVREIAEAGRGPSKAFAELRNELKAKHQELEEANKTIASLREEIAVLKSKTEGADASAIRAAAKAAAEQVVHNFENVIELLRFDISATKLGLPVPSSLPPEQRRDAMRRIMKEESDAELNKSDEHYAGVAASEDYYISGLGAAFHRWFASLPDPKPDFQEAQNMLIKEALIGRGFEPKHTGRKSVLPPRRKLDP